MKYILQKSEKPRLWVCTDTKNEIVVVWEEGKFNETQKVTVLSDKPQGDALFYARTMRDLTDWLLTEHKEIL